MSKLLKAIAQYFKTVISFNGELGGYVHDTAMCMFVPSTLFQVLTGTWTQVAGATAKTVSRHKAAAAETTVVTIPITIPSNSVSNKGSYLKSIEIDMVIGAADVTSITPLVNLVSRGIEGAVPTVTAQTFTQSPAAASAVVADEHKLTLTITTPFWVANTQYVLVELTIVCAAGSVLDFYGAFANFTERM